VHWGFFFVFFGGFFLLFFNNKHLTAPTMFKKKLAAEVLSIFKLGAL